MYINMIPDAVMTAMSQIKPHLFIKMVFSIWT